MPSIKRIRKAFMLRLDPDIVTKLDAELVTRKYLWPRSRNGLIQRILIDHYAAIETAEVASSVIGTKKPKIQRKVVSR